MENNFDKSIKKMLENYEVEYKPSDWNLMEEKIEEHSDLHPELDDALLDGMVYDSLHNLEEPYDPEHWNLMRERLDMSYAFRRKLVKYKVTEVALVLLFIFTLIQYIPPIKNMQLQRVAATDNIEANDQTKTLQSEAPQQLYTTPASLDQEIIERVKKNPPIIDLALKAKQINTALAAKRNEVRNEISSSSLPAENHSSEILPSLKDEETLITEESRSEDPIAVTEATENILVTEAASSGALAFNADLLNPILLKEEDKLIIPGIEEVNSSEVFSDLKEPIKVRIGMAIGADANYIATPGDEYYNDQGKLLESFEGYKRLRPGYSGGFTLGFQYDKWEIETSALYSSITYSPKEISVVGGGFGSDNDGFVEQELKSVRFDVIRLPVNLKYNFFTKKKWNVYLYSGASLNLSAKTFYDFAITDAGEESDGASRNFLDNNERPTLQEQTQHAENGIFEGGQFSRNTFLSANLGFGIERYFTPRMSIFLQPNYQHHFSKEFGPQRDKIHSISFLTGAKVTLQKRKKSKR